MHTVEKAALVDISIENSENLVASVVSEAGPIGIEDIWKSGLDIFVSGLHDLVKILP